MKVLFAALFVAAATWVAAPPVLAQAQSPSEQEVTKVLSAPLSPEQQSLGVQLVKLSGIGRTFDQLLPNIADQAKNGFIRANPQMQLGIIQVVDKVALTLVARRPELDKNLAKVWAAGFTEDEMRQLVDFYQSDLGKKFAAVEPQLLGVQLAVAERWGRSVGEELKQKVTKELQASMAAEQNAIQSSGSVGKASPKKPAKK
jgi:hypothetical protein